MWDQEFIVTSPYREEKYNSSDQTDETSNTDIMYHRPSPPLLVLFLLLQVVRGSGDVAVFRRQAENAVDDPTNSHTITSVAPAHMLSKTSPSITVDVGSDMTTTIDSSISPSEQGYGGSVSPDDHHKVSISGNVEYSPFNLSIEDQFVTIYENTIGYVEINFDNLKEPVLIECFGNNDDVFVVLNDSLRFDPDDVTNGTVTIVLRGATLGVSSLLMFIYDVSGEVLLRDDVKFTVKTFRIPRLIDKIFDYLLLPLIVVTCAGMGCRMDIEIIREKLKKPIGILVGPICQFISQPFFAFVISRFIMKFDGLTALGLVTVGSCPGGGMSNMITLLIGADLIQSITMTFTSNVCALGMLPLNMFLYGSYFLRQIVEEGGDGASFKIPIVDIIFQIGMLAGPVLVGMFVRYKVPKVAHYVNKSLGVVSMVLLLLTLSIGVYSNIYVLTSSGWRMMIGAALLPVFGFITGFLVARFLTRQPLDSSMTVSVETGVQNNLIAISMIKLAYPQPEADMMARLPIIVSITALSVGVGMVLASYPIHRFRRYRQELEDRKWPDGRYDGVHYEEMHGKKSKLQLENEIAPPNKSYGKIDDDDDEVNE